MSYYETAIYVPQEAKGSKITTEQVLTIVWDGVQWIVQKVKGNKAAKAKAGALKQTAAAAQFTALMAHAHAIARERNTTQAKTATYHAPAQHQPQLIARAIGWLNP